MNKSLPHGRELEHMGISGRGHFSARGRIKSM